MINFIKKILGYETYVSDIDQFITGFDQHHPQKSTSQREEIAKYNRVFYLRDHVVAAEKSSGIWQSF